MKTEAPHPDVVMPVSPEERQLIEAIRDPHNPVNIGDAFSMIGSLSLLLANYGDRGTAVGPAHLDSVARSLLAAFPEELRARVVDTLVTLVDRPAVTAKKGTT